jgi:hypothetical protein
VVVAAEDAVITMVPTIAFPPAIPATANVTAADALPAPLTVAVKTSEPPAGTLLEAGVRLTAIVEGVCTGAEDSDGADVLPHAERNMATAIPGSKMLWLRVKISATAEMREGIRMHTCMGKACATAEQRLVSRSFFARASRGLD